MHCARFALPLSRKVKNQRTMPETFLPHKGNYRNLLAYKKAECIYDITYFFAKQNIAEGSAAAVTSSEMEIKLTNVAKASLKELLEDYLDYLRVRNLQCWDRNDPRARQTKAACHKHSDSAYYCKAIEVRSDETIANIAIMLLHQTDFLLERLLVYQQEEFLKHGGIKERMFQARKNYRSMGSSGSLRSSENSSPCFPNTPSQDNNQHL